MNSTKNTLSPTIFQHQNRVLKQIDNRSEEKVTGYLKTVLLVTQASSLLSDAFPACRMVCRQIRQDAG